MINYIGIKKGQQFVNAFGLQLPSHMQIQKTDLYEANIKSNEDLFKRQFSETVKPLLQPPSTQITAISNRVSNGIFTIIVQNIRESTGHKLTGWMAIGETWYTH